MPPAPSDVIFRERLEQMANRVPGLNLRFTVEEPDPFRAARLYREAEPNHAGTDGAGLHEREGSLRAEPFMQVCATC